MKVSRTSSTVVGQAPPAVSAAASKPSRADRQLQIFMAVVTVCSSLAVLTFVTEAGATSRFNDFYVEAWPAYAVLSHGHLLRFLQLGPAYVGSLVLRAPFALIPTIWGGGPREVFFAAGLPCMLALAAFCMWLSAQPRRRGGVSPASRLSPVALCIFSPVILIGLFDGHPEELLGGVLCVAAVVVAARGKAGLAGVLVGLAVVNKSWALVAVPVVLAVMPAVPRRAVVILAAAAVAIVLLVLVADSHGLVGIMETGTIGSIFNPPQLLWWFGPHSWIAHEARAGILILAVGCSVLWRLRRHGVAPAAAVPEALLLLALVLFVRAAFDPWNNLYYHEPFLFALIAYEATSGRMPILMAAYSVLLLVVVPLKSFPPMSPDLRAASYAMLAIPTLAWLAARIYLPAGSWKRLARAASQWLPRRVAADEVTAG